MKVKCSVSGCDYETEDVKDEIVVALLNLHAKSHTAASANVEQMRRPMISSVGSTQDWDFFIHRWNAYKTGTALTGSRIASQLLQCCGEELLRDVMQSAGYSLENETEKEVLAAIEAVAVKADNSLVARYKLHNMRQDVEEPIRSFSARIKSQASVCNYVIKCPSCSKNVDYTSSVLRDVLCSGLADEDVQGSILGDSNDKLSYDDVLLKVEAKESGRVAAAKLRGAQSSEAVRSTYTKLKTEKVKSTSSEKCNYCGNKGHGKRASAEIRRSKCPAFNTTCDKCKKKHHFKKVCRSKAVEDEHRAIDTSDTESDGAAALESLCSVDTTPDKTSLSHIQCLDHHIYDEMCRQWMKRPSRSQPYMKVEITAHEEDYKELGLDLGTQSSTATIQAMADTGCQSCLASINVIKRLGFTKKDIIPVRMRMNAANNGAMNLLGAVVLRIKGEGKNGVARETRQIVYVTDNSEKFFLSRESLIALGVISKSFPDIDSCHVLHTYAPDAVEALATETANCGCPLRTAPPPLPTKLPFKVTENNSERLRAYLLDLYKASTFNTCEHQVLPKMNVPPMRLMVDSTATPKAYHKPIPVPLHWQDEVKEGLQQDVRLGVIEEVPIGEPVTWCHRMVICAKKSGKPRRTVDFQPLNAHAVRETHHTQSPFHQARSVPPSKLKTVFDAWNGYHSVPLHPDDRHMTTFITPWGRYRYCVAPQGYIASGDGYSRRYDELVADIPNKTKCIDDTLLWSNSIEESFFQAAEWLDTCGRNGITLNPEKFQFAQTDVEFAGFVIGMNNVRPCDRYIEAIRDFPTPHNLTDMRSWFGLINQVSYTFSMADKMLPFRELLKPDNKFSWTDELDRLFKESKSVIIGEIEEGVRIFDKNKPTCLTTDWSKDGIGFSLFQKHCKCTSPMPFCCNNGWKLTLVGSRFTHPAESRYAPIEGEALAVVDALNKARFFILGCSNLIVAVDHKPLLKVFGDRSLEDITNNRLRNLKEKTLRFKFTMTHIPGVKNKAADATSRHPAGSSNVQKMHLPDDVASAEDCLNIPQLSDYHKDFLAGIRTSEPYIDSLTKEVEVAATSLEAIQSVTWDRTKEATASDDNFHQLLTLIENGMPEYRHELPPSLQEFHQYRDHLHSVDGVVMYKDRIVIPPSLRPDILASLHAAHQGVTMMTSRASSSVFWPGIHPAIIATRENCYHCNRMAPSQPSAPPIEPVLPAYPFQCICSDYFTYKGVTYLVTVDRYSNWPIIERARGGAKGLVDSLGGTFTTYGIPEELASDGGPEFTAPATQSFLKSQGVHHRLSSVAFPHSNSRAEIGVKTVKRLITDNTGPTGELNKDSFQRAILQYRNTPDPDTKLSPAMCIFGRPIRDFIPIPPGKYKPHKTWQETLKAREEALRNRHMRCSEYWSEHTKRLPPLKVGDHVRIQNQTGPNPRKWDKTGTVVEVKQFDQYKVKVDGSGRSTLRNRKFLRKYTPVQLPRPTRTIDEDSWHIRGNGQEDDNGQHDNHQAPPAQHDLPPMPLGADNTAAREPAIQPDAQPVPNPDQHAPAAQREPAAAPHPAQGYVTRSGRVNRPPRWMQDFVMHLAQVLPYTEAPNENHISLSHNVQKQCSKTWGEIEHYEAQLD